MLVFSQTIPLYCKEKLKQLSEEEGFACLVDKPIDWTSFDVVAKLRNLTKIKKIGHAGTLDPLATGLLILCFGRKATKKISDFQNQPKKYDAVVKLGAKTKTYDSEVEEEDIKDTKHINLRDINKILKYFIGQTNQTPPKYSALKVNGQQAYKLARKNQEFQLSSKKINIYDIQINLFENPLLKISVTCSKGTYIRSLANDIGESLNVGGYLFNLRRTAIGNYQVDNAYKLNDLITKFEQVEAN